MGGFVDRVREIRTRMQCVRGAACVLARIMAWTGVAILISCTAPAKNERNELRPVARVYDRSIVEGDLVPTESDLDALKREFSDLTGSDLFAKARARRLREIVWGRVIDEFSRTHGLEPTSAEVENAMKAFDWGPIEDGVDAKIVESARKAVCRDLVKNWKICKALYDVYGGDVVFQQGNPLEPVGAYRSFLEDQVNRGSLEIYDSTLERLFWEYYVWDHRKAVPAEKIDYSAPWWD